MISSSWKSSINLERKISALGESSSLGSSLIVFQTVYKLGFKLFVIFQVSPDEAVVSTRSAVWTLLGKKTWRLLGQNGI